MSSPEIERVIAYIDGFNLYFGLRESRFQRYFWLNIEALILKLINSNQYLTGIKYFTSLVTNNLDKRLRQKEYIKALSTLESVQIIYGTFQKQRSNCNICGQYTEDYSEKMTDVNIAVNIINDYHNDRFDMAMLISGDTDLIPPIRLINSFDTNKRVFVAFPPGRVNDDVRKHAKGSMVIGRKNLADSQFPDEIELDGNEISKRPVSWA
jgi:uncharacterized LabA/DUF88 family protein